MKKQSSFLVPALFALVLLVIAGWCITLVSIAKFGDFQQWQISQQYAHAEWPPAKRSALLESAHDYNQTIQGLPILDPFAVAEAQRTGDRYWNELGDDVIARLQVPELGIDMPVRHGTSDRTITDGVGHLYGTALPVGGEGTRAVLTSHRATSEATLFDRLPEIDKGALILIDVGHDHLAYKVRNTQTVLPDDISSIHRVEGEDLLTLFTCTPYAVNTHRFVATAERVPLTMAREHIDRVDRWSWLTLERWMWPLMAGGALGVVFSVLLVVRRPKQSPPQ